MIQGVISEPLIIADGSTKIPKLFDPQENDWYDGSFHGILIQQKTDDPRYIQGNFNLGRYPSKGAYYATITIENETIIGRIQGFFTDKKTMGIIQMKPSNTYKLFIGNILKTNDTYFQLSLNLFLNDTYVCKGFFDYSYLPPPTGIYNIGIEDRYIKDTNRFEEFTDDPTDNREMMIRIWYPIQNVDESQRIDYMSYWTFQWLKNRSPIPLITINDDAFKDVHPHGYKNESILYSETPFPLLIFSPGYDGNYEIYTSFIEEMVSHGYIVLSINHPYVSGLTEFPDGRHIYASPIQPCSFSSVVGDIYYILDYIEKLNQSDPHFKGMINCDSIGMYGHSYGGAATLHCMITDDRIKAGLTLDGAISNTTIPTSFDRPLFMMLAENSFAYTNSMSVFDVCSRDAFILSINGSTHYAFTDVGLLMNHMLPFIPPQLLLFGTINQKRMVNITKTFILSFFQVYLQNAGMETLFDAYDQFPEINLQYKI